MAEGRSKMGGRRLGFETQFREMLREGSSAGMTDAMLLERFAAGGSQAAFEALVSRHGRMVLATCRGLLGDSHDAEDAFQATFLVLARKARAIRNPDLLGAWLHGVARRTATRAKTLADRRRHYEGQVAMTTGAGVQRDDSARLLAPDEAAALHEEVGNLPERYRVAVVLCYFEGQTHEEAARRLRRPVGTISARLSRARALLLGRLTRRGLAPSAILATLIAGEAASAAIPRALMDETTRSVAGFAAGRMAGAGVASASVLTLTEGALSTMSLSRSALAAGAILLASGLIALSYVAVAAKPRALAQPDDPPPAARAPKPVPKQETTPITVRGRAVHANGKPVAGASISLVSTNGIDARLGTATTDADGRYQFVDVDLPVRREREDAKPSGTFQVYGTAKGLGFAWHGMRSYIVGPSPPGPIAASETSYYEGDEVLIDLIFRPAAALRGRVTDETGKPVKDAEVEITGGDYVDLDGRESHKNFREFWIMYMLPRSMIATKTDADGRFRLEGLPEGTFYHVGIRRGGFATRSLYASNADGPVSLPIYPGDAPREIAGNDLALTLVTARNVKARVVFGDTSQPAPKMRVSADSRADGVGSWADTDERGEATLPLPPGDYKVTIDPPRGSDCVRTQADLTVLPGPKDQPAELKVARGCLVVLEAVDAQSGKGIRGVSFTQSPGEEPEDVRSVQSSTNFIDNPLTGPDGRLRIVTNPGLTSFRVGRVLEGSGHEVPVGRRVVDLRAGETVELKFELDKSRQ